MCQKALLVIHLRRVEWVAIFFPFFQIGGEAASRNRTCAQAKESQKRDGQRLQEDREISQAEQDCVEQVLLLTDSLFERGGVSCNPSFLVTLEKPRQCDSLPFYPF